MNKLVLSAFLALFLCSASVHAQNAKSNDKLLSKYSQKELSDLKQNSPKQYAYWSYYADNRGTIVQLPAEKMGQEMVEIDFDVEAMNFLSVDLSPYWIHGAVLRIAGTDKSLIISPQELFIEEFNATTQK